MKKVVILLVAFFATAAISTSCYFESIDTQVAWGFADDDHSPISSGLEILLPSAQTVLTAFDNSFFAEYGQSTLGGHRAIMKAQSSRNNAIKNIKKCADAASATLPEGFTCPIAGVFVVRMTYGTKDEETVWVADYRSN